MYLKSLNGCTLAIGSSPYFKYDARGGGGNASLILADTGTLQKLRFDPSSFAIPPLTWRNTRFLALPIPPGLSIKMHMDKLEGTIDEVKKQILLEFEARFVFSVWPLLNFPELRVNTVLTTASIRSELHHVEGKTINKDGRVTLVGVATIPPTGNKFLDLFLGLPNEALAILRCEILKDRK